MRLLSGHPDILRTIGELHQVSHMFGSPFQISSLQRRQKKAEMQAYLVLDLLVQAIGVFSKVTEALVLYKFVGD